ncbi:3'-5' exonuclease [Halalkalibacillus halophilus]|uniref:3'-5' exonuclease n=1 Tax=Halalkalibacillus halophilus TaxID=392827 RepID=UPI001FDEB96B|nr:exonuclease domain-containing protein [Halalkalibacillus halophilus]
MTFEDFFTGIVIIAAIYYFIKFRKKKKDKNDTQSDSSTTQPVSTNKPDYYQPRRSSKLSKPEHMKYTKAKKLSEDYTVIDFETKGFDPERNKIIQIAAVKYRNHEKVEEFTTNVNPQSPLSPKIKRITGLTDEDVKSAPLIQEALPNLLDFIKSDTLIAHNASFDMKFLLHKMHEQSVHQNRVYLSRSKDLP